MKSLHFNNHSSSKQSTEEFAKQVFTQLMENRQGMFQITMDDGDGDVYLTTVVFKTDRMETVTQIKEN